MLVNKVSGHYQNEALPENKGKNSLKGSLHKQVPVKGASLNYTIGRRRQEGKSDSGRLSSQIISFDVFSCTFAGR